MNLRRLTLTLLAIFGVLAGCAQLRMGILLTEPTDPAWPTKYWGLARINPKPAWQRVADASPVVIAVVDSGVVAGHRDLVNVERGGTRCPAGTGNDDVDGHGTKVAGIIAGKPSGDHAVGVAWLATLRPHRFLCPSAFFEDAARDALREAVAGRPTPTVVNASWAHLPWDPPVAAAIDRTITSHPNVLFVFAAPPATPPYPGPPAPHPYPDFTTRSNVVIVTASDESDRIPRWAGRDRDRVHIAAPGVGIATADVRPHGSGTTTFRGTSAAAAFVSGCAALVKRAAETASTPVTLKGEEIRDYLLKHADKKTELQSGVIDGRRLNCGAAVSAVPR
jgi:subtilisin family serine protease